MQIYAVDAGKWVIAANAKRSCDYLCPECGGVLRLRGGPSKQIHFYHISSPSFCRQHQKSEEHIQTQMHLAAQAGDSALIESPFSSIRRIADVAWEKEKTIFEVQCSPISLAEAKGRCEDYEKEGYSVLWVLHDKQFNRKKVSAAEEFLRSQGAYYTNIDKQGRGTIYDQFEVIIKSKRVHRGPPLPISSIRLFKNTPSMPPSNLSKILENRISCWKRALVGDLFHRIFLEGSLEKTAKEFFVIEELFSKKKVKKRLPWLALLKFAYLHFFHQLTRANSKK